MTAPPIPVPNVKNILLLYSFKAPILFSAIAAHFASFLIFIGKSISFFKFSTMS